MNNFNKNTEFYRRRQTKNKFNQWKLSIKLIQHLKKKLKKETPSKT